MQQLHYVKKNKLEWRDLPDPVLSFPKEAIVRPIVAGRCDGDMLFLANNITKPIKLCISMGYFDPLITKVLGNNPFQGPFAVGHECVAEVVSVGEEVKTIKPGEKVIVPWAISCGDCSPCHSGLTSNCSTQSERILSAYGFGSTAGPWGGMISDLLKVPFADAMLVQVPDGIDPVHLASASDNIADGWRTVAPHLKKHPHSKVLVVGGGAPSIGLYAAGIAVAMGASEVDYIDSNKARLEVASRLGANPIQISKARPVWYNKNAPIVNGKYSIAVDASSLASGLNFAIRSLSPGGICTSVGYYFQKKTGLPLLQMYMNGTTFFTGLSHPRADLPDLLELIKTRKFRPEMVTTLVADWKDAPRAYLERGTKLVLKR
jgi:threonine dehydrogenase-like Zn-dependent dehydrogenase